MAHNSSQAGKTHISYQAGNVPTLLLNLKGAHSCYQAGMEPQLLSSMKRGPQQFSSIEGPTSAVKQETYPQLLLNVKGARICSQMKTGPTAALCLQQLSSKKGAHRCSQTEKEPTAALCLQQFSSKRGTQLFSAARRFSIARTNNNKKKRLSVTAQEGDAASMTSGQRFC